MVNRTYLCIDLKTFFASCECSERSLDPFTTNLVVCDPTRGNGALCLAITPAMKKLGIKNRCRLFEIPKDVEFIISKPRMALYIDYSATIYSIYLKFISKDDIHVYSIDEAFIDCTQYLKLYKMDAFELAKMIIDEIYKETNITATCGIGTNLYLSKIALDITAKHTSSNIAYLNEEIYKDTLKHHTPLTDFWRVGAGTVKRLNSIGIYDMDGITKANNELLKKHFGVDYKILKDHAFGIEPVLISDIKKYKSRSNSLSLGQVLFEDYNINDALLILKEMVDLLSLELVDRKLVTNHISLHIGYSKDIIPPLSVSKKIDKTTNVYSILVKELVSLYEQNVSKYAKIRNVSIGFGNVISEEYEQLDLFTDPISVKKERDLENTINEIKKKFGKNSILRGMNYDEMGTTRKRNTLIGGHNSGKRQ